jgi:carboxylesterase type B
MQNAWIAFAVNANPGSALGYSWPAFTEASKQSALLNSEAVAPLQDYRGEYCDFWARYLAL